MKLSKFYLLMAAGLAVVACNKSEVTGENDFGSAPVSVSVDFIDAAQVKGLETPTTGTTGQTAPVQYNRIVLKLTAISGGGQAEFTSKEEAEKHIFRNVVNPMRLEVLVNDATEASMTLTQAFVDSGLAAPYYGSASDFKDSGKTDAQTQAKIYTTDVKLNARMARLEMSGIAHKDDPAATGCLFRTLTFDGLFLNGALPSEGGQAVSFKTWAEANVQTNYLKYAVGANFLEQGKVWPEQLPDAPKCYAMNFFPAATGVPNLTLAFSGAAPSDPNASLEPLRYAVVKTYRDSKGTEITKFEPGKIYRITKLEVADKNITDTPDPTVEEIAIQATVQVAEWIIEDTTVEWK